MMRPKGLRVPVQLLLLLVLGLIAGCKDKGAESGKQVIILGFDGFDPKLAQQMMDEGRLPNFKKLAEDGGFRALGTSKPPHSPVAWSSIITGTDPGKHGIFDWLHRNPDTYVPFLCTTETTTGSGLKLPWGKYEIPLWGGSEIINLRSGSPFWDYLVRDGVNAHVYRMPANYPPNKPEGEGEFLTLTDMGTPDLVGSQGTFSFYTSGPFSVRGNVPGGVVYRIRNRDSVDGAFHGPADTLLKPDSADAGKSLEIPFRLYRDRESKSAVIEWQSERVVLNEGEWSDWKTISFSMGPGVGDAKLATTTGSMRLFLKRVDPYIELYVTPIQIDPIEQSLPISYPDDFAKEVAESLGRYYTQGLPEDTKALSNKVLSRGEFLQQAMIIHKERMKLLDYALDRYQSGLLFFYVGRTDQLGHMFWGAMLDEHPAITPEMHEQYKDVMMEVYEESDEVVAEVRERFPDATLLCISDHGFTSFSRGLNVNTWLVENGYAVRNTEADLSAPLNFDRSKSQAYAVGLNALYINLRGREKDGIVSPADKQRLMDEICSKLEAFRDPEGGEKVVRVVYQSHKVFSPDRLDIAPDMIIGYELGYRGSWATGLGCTPEMLVEDNTDAWCGDHCVAAELVPGVVFSNRPLKRDNPGLEDIAPTVLSEFGIAMPPQMNGGSLFERRKAK